MNKYLIIILTLIGTQAWAGGAMEMPTYDRTECKGPEITLYGDHAPGDISSSPTAKEVLSKLTPRLKLDDKKLLNGLIDGNFLTESGSFNFNAKEKASTVNLFLDSQLDSTYVKINGPVHYNLNLPLIHAQNQTRAVFDTEPRLEFMKIAAGAVSESEIQVQVIRILAEVRKCLKTEKQKNPWFGLDGVEEFIDVCVSSAQVSPETEVIEISRTYKVDSCKPFIFK